MTVDHAATEREREREREAERAGERQRAGERGRERERERERETQREWGNRDRDKQRESPPHQVLRVALAAGPLFAHRQRQDHSRQGAGAAGRIPVRERGQDQPAGQGPRGGGLGWPGGSEK